MTRDEVGQALQAYVTDTTERLSRTDWTALAAIADTLLECKRVGRRIFTAGNGGSLSTASHMANDFTKGCRVGDEPGFDIECLGDATAVITCLANDFSYRDIYSIQLETKASPGDLFVYFSGSGNSPNLVTAATTARRLGVTTIGFLGRDGGQLKALSDLHVLAPTDVMEQIEDMHLMYQHDLVCLIRSTLAAETARPAS